MAKSKCERNNRARNSDMTSLQTATNMLWKPVFLSDQPDYGGAAMAAFHIGLVPIPLLSGTMEPAVNVTKWWQMLCDKRIRGYWKLLPDTELGVIVPTCTQLYEADVVESGFEAGGLPILFWKELSLEE
jgi:hypothetical protein